MSEFPVVSTGPDVTRQVLADHPDLMLVAFTFGKKGAIGALHNHPHVQSTFVKTGRFRFSVDGVETEVGPGDSFRIKNETYQWANPYEEPAVAIWVIAPPVY